MQVNTTSTLTAASRPVTTSAVSAASQDMTQGFQVGNSQTEAQGSANDVTGVVGIGNLLSAGTAQYLMQLEQSMAPSSSSADAVSAGQISTSNDMAVGVLKETQDIAADPTYADTVAQQMTGYQIVDMISLNQDLADDGNAQACTALSASIAANEATVNALQPQMQALYQSDQAEGKSGAQTVADMLKLQLSQPQSYWNAMDSNNFQASAKGVAQARLDILQQAIGQNTSSSNSRTATTPTSADQDSES